MTTLADLLGPNGSAPTIAAGYYQAVKKWSLGGNDRYGDCVFVGPCNYIDLVTAVAGHPELVSEAEAEVFYAREAGFNSQNPDTDKGAVLEEMLAWWMANGWPADPTYKPEGWCDIEPGEIHRAVHGLGAVLATCMLPLDPDTQDPILDDSALTRGIDGTAGHCILIVGSNPVGYKLVTWAEPRDVSHEWWAKYGDSQTAVKLPDWKVP